MKAKLFLSLMVSFLLAIGSAPNALADQADAQAQVAVEQQININTANAEQIASLSGIGLKKAQAIVAWREQNGSFTSKQQLLEVKGIGEKILAKNTKHIAL